MKPEKQQLIHDLLGDDQYREATLLAGMRIVRRRRHRRLASQGLACMLVLAAVGLWLERMNSPHSPKQPFVQTRAQAATSPPQALTDDQLLALFPNTPVGLATLSDGRKRLIFPHPGDEQQFITRL